MSTRSTLCCIHRLREDKEGGLRRKKKSLTLSNRLEDRWLSKWYLNLSSIGLVSALNTIKWGRGNQIFCGSRLKGLVGDKSMRVSAPSNLIMPPPKNKETKKELSQGHISELQTRNETDLKRQDSWLFLKVTNWFKCALNSKRFWRRELKWFFDR